jgi:hypothetical protein
MGGMELFGWIVLVVLTVAVAFGAWVTAVVSSGWSGRIGGETWFFAAIAVMGALTAYFHCPFTISFK